MRSFVFIIVIALSVTAISTPVVRNVAGKAGFIDLPAGRKLHRIPTPLLGGVAIIIGAIAAFLLLSIWLPISLTSRNVLGTLAASGFVALVGLIDDRRRLPAWVKLGGQIGGFVILYLVGVRVQLGIPEWQNAALSLIWLVGISNAINFLDNMDGLSAGVSGVAASFILLLAVTNNQYLVAALSASILGACIGFLRYNFKPATIFMGDVGALFLGFLLAVLGIQLRFPDNASFVTWMVPVFILGLPIFDTALVIVSRMRRRVNPFTTAGKDHTSHRLVDMGFSERESVLVLYLVSGVFGMIGLFITRADFAEAYVLGAFTVALGAYAIWRFEKRRPVDQVH